MINVYHLASAAPIAMFGMFALWAAASKRHWFVRTVVVAAAVLATLLIPAYELAYQLGIESLVVVGGMAIWRRRRLHGSVENSTKPPRRRFSLSLETLMLTVVIVAVATAVIARTPQIESNQWIDLAISGSMSGVICLACVWLACGAARWPIRLIAAPFLIVALGASMHVFKWAGAIVRYWISLSSSYPLNDYLRMAWRDSWPGILFWTIAVGLGVAVLCAWLLLMRAAGWFDPFDGTAKAAADTPVARRCRAHAQWAAVVFFCAALAFPIALFYRLLTPTPIPTVNLPTPNGFDDFVAAGREVSAAAAAKLADQMADEELSAEISKHSAAFDKMHEGLEKETLSPYVFMPWVQDDAQALVDLLYALDLQAAYARRSKDVALELANRMDLLRLAHAENRGMAADLYNSVLGHGEKFAHADIWKLRTKLAAMQIKPVVSELWALDQRREPWSVRVERQRIIEENQGWQRHAALILAEWAGKEHSASWRIEHFRRATESRIVMIELGLRAYQLDHGRLPATLSELVPEYLPDIPQDPFGKGDIKYRLAGDSYKLYSLGPDGVDDDAKPAVFQNGAEIGDLTPLALFGPPVVANQPATQNPGTESDP
jgi:hypothetical protein